MGNLSEHFSRSEFACKCGCGFDTVDAELIKVLEKVRDHFKAAVMINSGCRCKKRNKDVGGSSKSDHLVGKAADVRVKGVHADDVADYFIRLYPNKYGIGRYVGRTHIDVRSGKPSRWDER